MGLYDQGSYSGGSNQFSDQRQSARDRLLGLLDEQKSADSQAAEASRQNDFNQRLGEKGNFISKGLGGAGMGMMLGGPVGAAIGGGLTALPSLLGGIFGHQKRGEGGLESIINTVTGSIGDTVSNPQALASAAMLGKGLSKPGSAESYLSKHSQNLGSGTHMAPSGSTYGPAMPSPRFQFSK